MTISDRLGIEAKLDQETLDDAWERLQATRQMVGVVSSSTDAEVMLMATAYECLNEQSLYVQLFDGGTFSEHVNDRPFVYVRRRMRPDEPWSDWEALYETGGGRSSARTD